MRHTKKGVKHVFKLDTGEIAVEIDDRGELRVTVVNTANCLQQALHVVPGDIRSVSLRIGE